MKSAATDPGKLDKEAKKAEKKAKFLLKQQKMAEPVAQGKKTTHASRSKGYDPSAVERKLIDRWKKDGVFTPTGKGEPFCMVLPPPNITGSLHIGHAMMLAIQDSIVRYKWLTGKDVLFLPGLDHAGIATQTVVLRSVGSVPRDEFMKAAFDWSEKYGTRICDQLDRLGGALDYTRKRFTLDSKASAAVSHAFCELYKRGLIYRENKIVSWCGKLRTSLSDLEVDYCDVDGGAYLDVDGGRYRFGMMYYIKYYLEGEGMGDNRPYVVVGTTRPETILGDTAICVNPDDPRFKDAKTALKLVDHSVDLNRLSLGKHSTSEKNGVKGTSEKNGTESTSEKSGLDLLNELKTERKNRYKAQGSECSEGPARVPGLMAVNPLTGKRIPVIVDRQADLGFGTGVLKVTPSHDPADFKLGKKHGLEFIQVFDDSNTVTMDSPYKGLGRFEARKRVLEDLGDDLVASVEHSQVLPFCSRSGDIVEPMVKEQWWMRCGGMARRAADAVRNGEIRIVPAEAEAVWYRWLDNAKDWCLSRQLWWGHRIPAYRARGGAKEGASEWIVAGTEEEARARAKELGYTDIVQDEDVLDTWFSSGLWPFSTLGWPERTADLERYFPNSVLETGSDILFFWVARMVMLSYELCGQAPFHTILLHGIVRDSHGRKMSKSLGNVVDPISVIEGISLEQMIQGLCQGNLDKREVKRATDALKKDYPNGIPKCGADALRFALLSYASGMKDINLDVLRVQGYARLCNKIYNSYNLINIKFGSIKADEHGNLKAQIIKNKGALKEHQRWILEKLKGVIDEQHRTMERYNFMAATQSIHNFFLYSFCDVFLEAIKDTKRETGESTKNEGVEVEKAVALFVFSAILTIFNPYMPFITEELHLELFGCRTTVYPSIQDSFTNYELKNQFDEIVAMAKVCRARDVIVKHFKGEEYLITLLKGNVKMVDNLEEGKAVFIGDISYQEL